MMKQLTMYSATLLSGLMLLSGSVLSAAETGAATPPSPPPVGTGSDAIFEPGGMLGPGGVMGPQGMMGNGGMRQDGRGGMMRDPMVMTARLVHNELKTYQASPTTENYTALENALKTAMAKDTARRKEMLEKRQAEIQKMLSELDKTQTQRMTDFLTKVKSGEFKMPERPAKGKRGQRGMQQAPQPPAPSGNAAAGGCPMME